MEIAELMQNAAWIQNLAYATLGDHALAEDVTQEVLLQALRGEKRTGPVLRSWLAAATRNLSRNQLRSASRRRKREARMAKPESVVMGKQQSDTLQAHRQLLEAVEALPFEQRNILVMRFFQEHSFEHIAKSLAITPGAARVRLHRALQTLRGILTARKGNWRHLCLGLAPMPWRPSHPLANASALFSGLALVFVTGFLWWFVAYGPQSNRLDQESEFAVTQPPFSTSDQSPGNQASTSVTRTAWEEQSAPRQEAQRTLLEGVVFANRKPASGVTVSCWQAGELSQLLTDTEGEFSFPVHPSFRAQITAEGSKAIRTQRWEPGESRRLLMDLWDPPQSGLPIRVFEAITKAAIPNAKVQIWLDYSGGDRGTSRHHGFTKLLAEGETNQDGNYLGEAWIRGASPILKVSAPGFHPNVGTTWGFSRAAAEVALVKGNPLPIQLMSPQGVPYANTKVDSGIFFREELTTDGQGFLPVPAEWTLPGEDTPVAALPSRLKLKLQDGRIWQGDARVWTAPFVHVLGDRIQLVVDTKAVRVQLGEVLIPEHHWIEVRCADYVSHDWIAEDVEKMWHRVESGQVTTLTRGWVGPSIRTLRARLMPSESPFGKFKLEGDLATVHGQASMVHFTLLGIPEAQSSDYVLVLPGYSTSQQTKIPFQQGVAHGAWAFKLGSTVVAHVENQRTGQKVLLKDSKGAISPSFSFLAAPDVRATLQTAFSQQVRAQIFVGGVAVVGGEIDNLAIDEEGYCTIPVSADGEPICQLLNLRPAPEIDLQEQTPILSSFLFEDGLARAGKFAAREDGTWAWYLSLATVELWVPAAKESQARTVLLESSFLRSNPPWPKQQPEGILAYLSPPPEEGWLRFRLPAGKYRLRIGDQVYGGGQGIDCPANTTTRLQPKEDGSGKAQGPR